MNALYSITVILALAACTAASDAASSGDRTETDSTMVVASEARVPSESDASSAGPRVVFLGTSLTAGFGLVDPDEGYVAVLDAMGDSAGLPFQAVNAGVSGETSAGGLRRLDWILRQPIDVLVLELGANDGLRGQSPEALRDNLDRIVQSTRTRYPDVSVVLAGMEAPPNLGARYTADFRAVFPQIAAAHDATLIPFLLDGVAGVAELNQDDRIHPTPEGHRRVAATVWPYLEPLLVAARSRS